MEKVTDLVYIKYNGKCQFCGLEVAKSAVIYHHIKNRSQKGPNTVENLCPRHPDCENFCHHYFKHGNPSEGESSQHFHKPKKQKYRNYPRGRAQ